MSRKKKHRLPLFARILTGLLGFGLLCYLGIVGFVCIREGSVRSTVPEEAAYEAIIVLGAQVQPDGNPSVQLAWRLDKGLEAWQRRRVPMVLCGARGGNEPMPEAEAMRNYLTARGVPEEDLLLDPDSFNTNQNLENAQRLLSSRPEIQKVLIVTSDYHVPRAMAIAEDLGYTAQGLGSPCKPEYWIKNHAREVLAWCKYWANKYLGLKL